MQDQHKFLSTAISGLLALGVSASSSNVYATDNEKCFGISKAGQNGCNSNRNKHSCAGHSKIDNDPNDFILVPAGSCLKVGGKLESAIEKQNPPEKY